jgi:hypothetical protein
VKTADRAELDAAPPPAFVRARNALAARLRTAGRVGEAAEIARLRRPSLVPWLVNRLAQTNASGVRRLLAEADRLRRATLHEPDAIPDATVRHRAALHHLVQETERLLAGAHLRASPSVLRRVHATLSAAAADRSKHAQLRQGRLAEELEPGGFAVLGAMPSPHLRLVKPDQGREEIAARENREHRRQREAIEREQRQTARRESAAQRRQMLKLQADAVRRERTIQRATRQATRLREELRRVEERIERERRDGSERR